jgi:FkbM family methyltransferase
MWLQFPGSTDGVAELIRTEHLHVHTGQVGEDALLWHMFGGKRDGFYVDIGCSDPLQFSNTHLLHRYLGWSGINVDADPRAIQKFQVARPGDTNLHCGIAAEDGTMDFHLFESGVVSTFLPDVAVVQTAHFGASEVVAVPTMRLSSLLTAHVSEGRVIDLLDIDCEGLDHDVLLSNDWTRFRPTIVLVELHHLDLGNLAANPTVILMKSVGYRLVSHILMSSFFQRID